jgi:aspartyl-tRNA(Asn)/glutamyl-tRNA(Gln) amidotransferase subunit C
MSFTKEQIKKIAHLARIEMDESELDNLSKDFNAIIEWINQLSEVDTKNIEPMFSTCDYPLPKRKDEVFDMNTKEDILANAPDPDEGKDFFTVPKVIE